MAFLCGRGFPPTASLRQGSLGAPLQQFPPRPLPLPLKGPAQDSRESGRAWGEPGASFRAGRGRPQAEGVAEGTRGGRGRRGTTREPRRRRPGIPPQALRKTRKAVLQPPSPPEPSPADLSLLLNGSPLEHTSPVVTSPRALLPCPWHPLVNGLFGSCYWLLSPAPGSCILLSLGFLAKRSRDAWGEEGDRQWSFLPGKIRRPRCVPWWNGGGTILGILEGWDKRADPPGLSSVPHSWC